MLRLFLKVLQKLSEKRWKKKIEIVPYSILYIIIIFLFKLFWNLPHKEKVSDNLHRAFPLLSEKEIGKLAKNYKINYLKFLAESTILVLLSPSKLERVINKCVRFKGEEEIHDLLKLKKGLIFISPHLGNHLLGAISMVIKYKGLKMNIFAAFNKNSMEIAKKIEKEFNDSGYNVKFYFLNCGNYSIYEFIKLLRRGEIILLNGDYSYLDYVSHNKKALAGIFLNSKIYIPRGPSLLNQIVDSHVVLATCVREKFLRFRIEFQPLLENFENELYNKNINISSLRIAKIIENIVKKFPEQWLLWNIFHKMEIKDGNKKVFSESVF